jgi:hypothetical protein
MLRLLRAITGLISMLLSLLALKGCKPAPPPAVPGVSIELCFPVLLIGQRTFDVRDSEEALINVPGASSLSLNERVILDSDGRLYEVISARPEKGSESILLDMGTGNRRFEVIVREKKKTSFPEIREFALAEIRAPNSIWSDDAEATAKVVARIRSLQNTEELIAACREPWNWTR